MKRYSGMVKVFVRGRDIEEAEFAAEFNKDTCRWRLVAAADEVFKSEQRQAIATALKEAKRPMSVAEIMAATDRKDRHATQMLLIRMEQAGEVKHAGRGMWAHPNLSDLGDLVTNGSQAVDNNLKSGAAESHSKVTDQNASDFAVTFSKTNNHMKGNGNLSESHQVTEVTHVERGSDPGPIPECLRRAPNGSPCWPPALGPAGDDVFNIDPGWRPPTLSASSSVGRQ